MPRKVSHRNPEEKKRKEKEKTDKEKQEESNRLKDQEQWAAFQQKKLGGYQIWERLDGPPLSEGDDKLGPPNIVTLTEEGGYKKLPPGDYHHAGDPFNIHFSEKGRKASPFPFEGKMLDPYSPEYEAAYSRSMDLVSQDGSTIGISLGDPYYSEPTLFGDPYSHNKQQLETMLKLAAKKGLSVEFHDTVKQFLHLLPKEESDRFYKMEEQLRVNAELHKMELEINDDVELRKGVQELSTEETLVELPAAPSPDPNASPLSPKEQIQKKYEYDMYRKEDGSQRTTVTEKLGAIDEEIKNLAGRLEYAKTRRERILKGFQAQNEILGDPEKYRKGQDLEDRSENAKSKSRVGIVEEIQNINGKTHNSREALLVALDKEIADLTERQEILQQVLKDVVPTPAAGAPPTSDQKERDKRVEDLKKVETGINGEKNALVEVREKHDERNDPDFYKTYTEAASKPTMGG